MSKTINENLEDKLIRIQSDIDKSRLERRKVLNDFYEFVIGEMNKKCKDKWIKIEHSDDHNHDWDAGFRLLRVKKITHTTSRYISIGINHPPSIICEYDRMIAVDELMNATFATYTEGYIGSVEIGKIRSDAIPEDPEIVSKDQLEKYKKDIRISVDEYMKEMN